MLVLVAIVLLIVLQLCLSVNTSATVFHDAGHRNFSRLLAPMVMRLPLVDGQGNFGSVNGDPAAAMRVYRVAICACGRELVARHR